MKQASNKAIINRILRFAEREIYNKTGGKKKVIAVDIVQKGQLLKTAENIAFVLGFKMEHLKSASRSAALAEARHVIGYICAKYFNEVPDHTISHLFNRERTFVYSSCKVVNKLLSINDKRMCAAVAKAENVIKTIRHEAEIIQK
ncbi:hypothetical protein KTO58_19855 [Chitinophaga pendula]|uniref:helix-turn-helix domain-containing protein n=1 Tax=Chitinophaga TaxID=79328 RepID=UPI0012FD3529|nr:MULTISPECIES: helix-turn-helix domain-containing protein [Chitinophaga]UCJ05926.1 hypothetical protein KTO58_19855 [Chitinophaga pendula]